MRKREPVIGITSDMDGEYLRLKHYYSDAIRAADGVPLLVPPVGNAAVYAEIVSGLLIPGGDDLDPFYYREKMLPQVKPVSRKKSDFEISLLREVIRLNKPALGICYGMQLINVAFGGSLYQDLGTDLQVEINHKKDYHKIVITENRFLKKGTFSVNSTHHQAVKKLGNSLSAFAYAPDNLIEAFYSVDHRFLVGVQWHPERLSRDELSRSLFEALVRASCDGE